MAEILFARLDELNSTIDGRALLKVNNFSDLSSLPTALVNLGLNNVDNTSDVNKPISTATQTALDGKQPLDATLTAFAAITFAADQIAYATAADTFSTTTLTAAGRSLIDDASTSDMRTTLGVVIGTDVQAYNALLGAISTLSPIVADRYIYSTGSNVVAAGTITAAGRAILDDATASDQRTTLGLTIGTDVQAYDADLAGIAGLTYSNGDILYYNGGFQRLAKGTDNQYLFLSGGVPAWTTLTGGGDMLSTNNLSDVASASTSLANIGGASLIRPVRNITTTTDTLVLTDAGKFVYTTNASPVTITVPPNSSVAFAVGTQIDFAQYAAGKLTFAQGSGVTINSVASLKSIATQNGGATLIKTGTDTWLLTGYLGS